MKKSFTTLLASAAGLGVLLSAIGVTEAHAKPRPYSFGNGTMYTIEFKEGDGFPQTVRLGTVGRNGRVTAVSDDWGLTSITSADYSSDTGLVYILARALLGGSSDERCTVMTWDPATPSVDPVTFFELPSTRTSCQSLSVAEGIMIWAEERSNLLVGHHEIYSRSSGEYLDPADFGGDFTWPIVGIDSRSDGKVLLISPEGKYALAGMETPVERRIRGLRGDIRDAQFDQRDRPWVMGQRSLLVSRLGVLSFKSRRVTWGKVLRDSVTRQVWKTDTIFFVPTATIG
jgi:hypothetical protein